MKTKATHSHQLFLPDYSNNKFNSLVFLAQFHREHKTLRTVDDAEKVTESVEPYGWQLLVTKEMPVLNYSEGTFKTTGFTCYVRNKPFLSITTPDQDDSSYNWLKDIKGPATTWPDIDIQTGQCIFFPCTKDGVVKRLVLGEKDHADPEVVERTYRLNKHYLQGMARQLLPDHEFNFDVLPQPVHASRVKTPNAEPIHMKVEGLDTERRFMAEAKLMHDKMLDITHSFHLNLSCPSDEIVLVPVLPAKADQLVPA